MTWNLFKAAALDALLKWVAGNLWALAQDMVQLVAQRDDLTGPEKLSLAREILLDKTKEMGAAASLSSANWLLECAVQYLKYRTQK